MNGGARASGHEKEDSELCFSPQGVDKCYVSGPCLTSDGLWANAGARVSRHEKEEGEGFRILDSFTESSLQFKLGVIKLELRIMRVIPTKSRDSPNESRNLHFGEIRIIFGITQRVLNFLHNRILEVGSRGLQFTSSID